MGTWGPGPFDNDCAADFASEIRSCTDPAARADYLEFTLRGTLTDLAKLDELDGDVEFDWGLLHGYAAAAFVADAAHERCKHGDSSFARGCADSEPYELLPPCELPRPSGELLSLAVNIMDMLLALLDRSDEFTAACARHMEDIRADLLAATPA